MFIKVLYGEKKILIANPNCTAKILMDFVKTKCGFDTAVMLDLCDELGILCNIHTKNPSDNLFLLLEHRSTYIPCAIDKASDDRIKSINPLLNGWEETYPLWEAKLKEQKRSRNEVKAKRRDKVSIAPSLGPQSARSSMRMKKMRKPLQ